MHPIRFIWRRITPLLTALLLGGAGMAGAHSAQLGLTTVVDVSHSSGPLELEGSGPRVRPPVTVFYPTKATAQPVRRGPFVIEAAVDAPPAAGNGHLVMLSHGSGGGPFVYTDLVRALVQAGFVVAAPLHQGDHAGDPGQPGPASWIRRPAEVSEAIDRVLADPRFSGRLNTQRIGLYGMSAGGHTALTMAGGQWSEASFAAHCRAHLSEDFQSCAGLATQLRGNWLDPIKLAMAQMILALRFTDTQPQAHHDPRVAAIVAAVPFAADFEMSSLAQPRVPVGLATAGQDAWLIPRFHSDRVLATCSRCERLAELPHAGHGAYLSPMPPGLRGLEAALLADPPGFDRSQLRAVDAAITRFFERHLWGETPGQHAGDQRTTSTGTAQ